MMTYRIRCRERPLGCTRQNTTISTTIDIYTVDTVLPVHIVWHEETTAKSTTQDGGMAETSVNAFI